MASTQPYSSECPTLLLLDRVASRWSVVLLALVSVRPMRFNQLHREVDGISQKMLSQTLKALERDGLVSRKVALAGPLTVEYATTSLGETLLETIESLRGWSDCHYEDVLNAQHRFDQNQGAASGLMR